MRKLSQMSPRHQVVVWMGPTLQKTWEHWVEITRRRATMNYNRALPGAQ